jgi:hypothetical protein
LKHHTDAVANEYRVGIGRVDVDAVELDRSGHARAGGEIVHPVERTEKCGLAASRWPDEGRNGVLKHREAGVLDRLKRAVKNVDVGRRQLLRS